MVSVRHNPSSIRRSSVGVLLALSLPLLFAAGCSTTLGADAWGGTGLDDSNDEDDDTGATTDDEDDGDDTGGNVVLVPECDPSALTKMQLDPHDTNALVSPAQARVAIESGDGSLADVEIEPREFLNYYDFDYPNAAPGELTIEAELFLPDLDPSGEWVLQIGVNGPASAAPTRPPANLSLVLDTSTSMDEAGLELLKSSAEALVASLRAGDRVAIVEIGQDPAVTVESYEVETADDPTLLDVIADLELGGAPDLEAALGLAYEQALVGFETKWLNRVVYIGSDLDGIEVVPTEIVMSHAGMPGEEGIHLVGAGVGEPGEYDGSLIDELTTVGRGTSLFVGDAQEGWRAFNERFMSTMVVGARDVSVRVDLPPGFRPAGADEAAEDYEPSAETIAADLAANRPIVLHERLENCAPDDLDANSELEVHVSWTDATTFVEHEASLRVGFGEAMQSGPTHLHKGRAVLAYADALAAWKTAYDAPAKDAIIADALVVVQEALSSSPEDADLSGIKLLLESLLD